VGTVVQWIARPCGLLTLTMFFAGTSRFRPIRLLGTGGMGSVHLVFDEQLQTEVALKTLNLTGGTDLYRFKKEFRALADIRHPNLVTLYELISEGPLWFFTMEYVPGLPFDQDLAAITRPSALAPSADSERLLRSIQQLCCGVHAMHESGCIHRDLKPSNVLIAPEGRVVILDFGLAKQRGSFTVSGTGVSGTPAYMAPEQALERPSLPAADWYAVGIMIYEVLTGKCPFEGSLFDVLLRKQNEDPPSPVQVNPAADELLAELCMRMIHRDPTQRPGGAEVLARLGVSAQSATAPPLRRLTPASTPALNLFGREHELHSLSSAYARMRKGNLSVVVVRGSSGIGKTCLVEAFLDDIVAAQGGRNGTPLVLRGRCHERETVPFKAFDNVVDGLSYRLALLDPRDQAYVLPDGISYLCEIFPVLRRLKLTEDKRYFVPPLREAKELRNQAFTAFCELMFHMARTQPIVIFIDDLQWADRDSFALLRALTRQPGAPPLMLVATCRCGSEGDGRIADPLLAEFLALPGIDTVEIGPLEADSTRALADSLIDEEDLSTQAKQQLVDAVVREAEGHPFFAVEFVHYLRNVVRGGPEVLKDGVVVRLESMILARVQSLPEESQRMLRVIAVAGDLLPQRVLATAAEVTFGGEEWERGMSGLVDELLVRRRGRQGTDVVETYHDRIRDAVVANLDRASLHHVHVQLAKAVEQWDRERTDMLARYWLSAEDNERAKRYAYEAAVEARAKLAFDRAAQLYEIASQLEEQDDRKAELLRAMGECQASDGRAILAADAFERAAAFSLPEQAARLRHLAAEQLLRGGEIAQGLAVLRDVLSRSGLSLARTSRKAMWSVTWRLLWLRLRGVKFREKPASSVSARDKQLLDVYWSVNTGLGVVDSLRAVDFLLRFLMLALRTGDSRRVAQGLAVLGGQLAAFGGSRFAWASRLVAEADVLARRSGDPATVGLARMCRAVVRYFAGEFEACAQELTAVEQYFLRHCRGTSWELATTRSFACFSLRLVGKVRELCERFDRYVADADRTGDRYLATNLRTYQCLVWLIRDQPERARRDIDGILDAWPADKYQVQHFFHLYSRCEQALYCDRPEDAWNAILAEDVRLRRSTLLSVSGVRIEHAWIVGRVALAMAEEVHSGERDVYLGRVRASVRLLSKCEHQTGVALGATLNAGLHWLTPGSKRDEAVAMLERAVATAESADALLVAESARRWLGELLGDRRGEELRARSNGWMAQQGVQNPAKIAHLVAPGFRRLG
jgi:eukaryotic-like serine/threonine-protein kinase